jgi:cytochrome c peroxidase
MHVMDARARPGTGKEVATMKRFSILIACLILLGAAATDPVLQRARATFSPIPAGLPEIEGNVITDAKVELGKMLFFDPRLSASHLLSCNTCHTLGLAGADLQETSTGHGWQRGPRNAPTVLNAAYNTAQFWDGRAPDLREQAKGPIQAAVEMNNSPDHVLATLRSIPEYEQRFEAAFAEDRDPLSFDNVAKAIEAFEATLQTPGAAFDRYLAGDLEALGKAQMTGLSLFMNKGCASCHGGINLGGNAYFPFGLVKTPAKAIRPESDKGRFAITRTAADEYVFRTPPLRNVELTYPYFHSGKVWTLREAVSVMGASQLGIELDDDQARSITVFLASLTGNQPEVEYPVLPASTEETPRPRLDYGGEADH